MQEECSVDTVPLSAEHRKPVSTRSPTDATVRVRPTRDSAQVQMLVGQLKTREQELAKKGRIVGARCPRSDFYASCTPIAAASSLRRRQRRWRWLDTRAG